MTHPPSPSQPNIKQVMTALDQAAARLETIELRRTEPIAVVGINCRFPGAEKGPDSFWSLLQEKRCSIAEIPPSRWDADAFFNPNPDTPGRYYTKRGAFLQNIDQFDARWFKISHREAQTMDPQHRLLLETAWNAFENAGIDPPSLRGKPVGVYVGTAGNEYASLIAQSGTIDAYYGSGNAPYAAAGRLAFTFGLHGPCMTLDTACSSSLVAVHAACQSLRLRECHMALVGGVNLMLTPNASIALCQAHMLSPEGLCKTFDASADGYVRGEGCAAIVLKRLSDVDQEKDFVWGWIRASAINHDGPGSGFTVPNGRAQEALYRRALKNAKLNPLDIDWIEAHGTGTSLGDPIEIQSLAAVYGEGRPLDRKIPVASVKTNLGHLEAVAGLAGLIKAVLSLHHGKIPPHLHFHTPNPHIPWDQIPIQVCHDEQPYPAEKQKHRAAVSSFGASGTNAHVILESAANNLAQTPIIQPKRLFQKRRYWFDPRQAECTVTLDLNAAKQRLAQRHDLTSTEKHLASKILQILAQSSDDPKTPSVDDLLYTLAWIPKARTASSTEDLHLSPPNNIVDHMQRQLIEERRQEALSTYLQGVSSLEALTPRFAINGLCDLGFSDPVGSEFSLSELAQRLQVHPQYHRMLNRLLEIAAQTGAIEPQNDRWRVSTPLIRMDIKQQLHACVTVNPSIAPEAELLERCAAGMVEIMRKTTDPLPVLFPEKGVSAARLYQSSPGAQTLNRLIRQAITAALSNLVPGQSVRILEIGAGTGGTTSFILPALLPDVVHYTFTDISPSFFLQAKKLFQAYPWVQYQKLDIESDPLAQGFQPQSYDIIVAANVLHATKHLPSVLQHVQSLLSPRGVLMLFEGTRPTQFIDLIFGLSEGWWRFDDIRNPNNHPLLSPQQWKDLLQQNGFDAINPVTPEDDWAGLLSRQSILIAQKSSPPTSLTKPTPSRILLLTCGEGLEHDIAEHLKHLPQTEIVVWNPNTPTLLHDTTSTLNTLASQPEPVTDIVCLCGLNDVLDDDWNADALLEVNRRVCGKILDLCKAFMQAEDIVIPSLWWITRNAVGSDLWNLRSGAPHAAVWGLHQSLLHESPEWKMRCLDIGGLEPNSAATVIAREVQAGESEDQIAYHQNRRFCPRLHPVEQNHFPENDLSIHPQGWYLITGGLGGIGKITAQWLIDRGARHIALLGRNQPTPETQNQIDRWIQNGCTIDCRTCDVADEHSLKAVLQQLRETGQPIRGVIHAAGSLDDGMLMHQTWPRFQNVMNAKVKGSWNLHRCTLEDSLDFFVLFSTTTSLFGSPGQANHAAANRFIDSLAAYRKQKGLPVISINWGPWRQVGAAAQRRSEDRFELHGFLSLEPSIGMQCLERILTLQPTQIVAVALDRQRLPQSLQNRPFLESLSTQAQTPETTSSPDNGSDWKTLPRKKQEAFFTERISQQVNEILGGNPNESIQPDQGFFDMGMDSLMAVELRNQIQRQYGITLSSTAAFNHPSVKKLVDHILATIHNNPNQTATQPQTAPPAGNTPDEWEGLGEEALGELLERELNQLEEPHR